MGCHATWPNLPPPAIGRIWFYVTFSLATSSRQSPEFKDAWILATGSRPLPDCLWGVASPSPARFTLHDAKAIVYGTVSGAVANSRVGHWIVSVNPEFSAALHNNSKEWVLKNTRTISTHDDLVRDSWQQACVRVLQGFFFLFDSFVVARLLPALVFFRCFYKTA